jgi:hypothetical protein
MKAIRFEKTGGPEVLQWKDVELTPPGRGEVRVRHTAVSTSCRCRQAWAARPQAWSMRWARA